MLVGPYAPSDTPDSSSHASVGDRPNGQPAGSYQAPPTALDAAHADHANADEVRSRDSTASAETHTEGVGHPPAPWPPRSEELSRSPDRPEPSRHQLPPSERLQPAAETSEPESHEPGGGSLEPEPESHEAEPQAQEADHDPSASHARTESFEAVPTPLSEAPPFPEELLDTARANPGGWVYHADVEAGENGLIPAERVQGAWRIDDHGRPTGEYVANRHYQTKGVAQGVRLRWKIAAVAALLLVLAAAVVVIVLATSNSGHSSSATSAPPSNVTHGHATGAGAGGAGNTRSTSHHTTAASAHQVQLELSATAPVQVCLVDGTGHRALNNDVLTPAKAPIKLSSSSFRMFLANSSVQVRVNGKPQAVATGAGPVAYDVSAQKLTSISGAKSPCA